MGHKYKSPRKRRRYRLRKHRFLALFREDPILVPVHVSGCETSLAPGPVSDPDTVTVNAMHLAMQRLDVVEDEVAN